MTSLILGKQNVGSEKLLLELTSLLTLQWNFLLLFFKKRKEKVERKKENQNKNKIIICFD